MGRGSSKAARAGGGSFTTTREKTKEEFIESIAQEMASPYSDEPQISNGDMQGMVESYAERNGLSFQEENEMTEAIRNRVDEIELTSKYGNQYQDALRPQNVKVGDNISADIRKDGKIKREMWTFHPEGYESFKSQPYSDIKVTDVKVTDKTVKITGLFDKANTKRDPVKSDWGKDFIEVTKTFKKDDVVLKRKK